MRPAAELSPQVAGVGLRAVSHRGAARRGAAPAVQGTLGGEGRVTMVPASAAVLSFLRAGDVRAPAAAAKERGPLAPEAPTFAGQGFPGCEAAEEPALFAPAGAPAPAGAA